MASIEDFKRGYVRAIRGGYAAIFAGAGLSAPSGYVNWKELLRDLANSIGLSVDVEPDLVAVAQYYCNEKHNRSYLNDAIVNRFQSNDQKNMAMEILASMPIKTYWTTNYDRVIEETLRKNKKRVDIKANPSSLATSVDGRDAVVYKMHGDYMEPANCVITKDDYEAYNLNRGVFSTALQGDLVSKTFLFIGFSFDDPNLGYILSRIRGLLNENVRNHYCFFENPVKEEKESDVDFTYRAHKQDLVIRDLQRYGIDAVLLKSYADIPEILSDVARRVKCNCIFISGSAESYGAWEEQRAIELIGRITSSLIDKDFKVMTGHGRGVGSFVISTVLEKYGSNIHEIDRHLAIRAFPYQCKGKSNYAEIVRDYRKDIFEQAGVAIFMFGNKQVDSKIEDAPGVYEEYTLAVEAGASIIPIGSTGFAAQKIFQEIEQNIDNYQYLKSELNTLKSSTDVEKITESVLSILRAIVK